MNGFIIDQQTFRDLNIFSETSASVSPIFKEPRSLGGRETLRQMMSNPSSDYDFITHRKTPSEKPLKPNPLSIVL